MKLLREYIRTLLKEDPTGFVHDLAASDKFGDQFFGGNIGKDAAREIKRAFNKNADHQFLSTLDTVHWTGPLSRSGSPPPFCLPGIFRPLRL